MNISPIRYNPIRYNNPNFKSNNREIHDNNGKLLYKTTTYIYREDLPFNDFVNLLKYTYQNTPKVNFINHACSNGAEAISIATKLIQNLGVEAEKFFPIDARDIDHDNIEGARNGRIGIKAHEIYRINENTNRNLNAYFEFGQTSNPDYDIVIIPKAEIKNKIHFRQSDIFEDIDYMPSKNLVLTCRNFWPYLEPFKRELLAKKLSQKLDQTCLLVIGDFDSQCNTPNILERNGFIETAVCHVYKKIK